MDKESAIKAIKSIEEVLENYVFGRANEHALKVIKNHLSSLERAGNLNRYINEKIFHISHLADILCSERKHQRYSEGVEGIKSLIRMDCNIIKAYIE